MLRLNRAPAMRWVALGATLLFLSGAATADTIVLKNGRRITALTVVEEGERVKWTTATGELSLPKSLVDHIERGGGVALGGVAGPAPNLSIAPPAIQSGSMNFSNALQTIGRNAVHDGSIDRGYIAKLEDQAHAGAPPDMFNAAVAHHAAASFELTSGDMDHALNDERTALSFAPEDAILLTNLAYIYLRRSEFKQALDYLERARRYDPDSADVAKLMGWSYYGLNKLDQAVTEWKRALTLRPEKEVQDALEQALRDKQEEESYKENESAHFKLRYNGAAEPALAREVLRTLEAHFAAIESQLNFTPPEPIGVILYTQDAFMDITRAPAWAGALYDGRIRVPVQGLTSMTAELSRSLKHELTHSFIAQKTRSVCIALAASCAAKAPTWIQEGMAQLMEGSRSSDYAAALVQVYELGKAKSLGDLEGDWTKMGWDEAQFAYAWSLANVEYIVQAGGMGDVNRLLDRIGAGVATEAALHEVLRSDYTDLMKSTAEYLRKTYVR